MKRRMRSGLTSWLLTSAIVPVLLMAGSGSSYCGESVVLAPAEADSVIALIDELTLEKRLLEVDLWEARAVAHSDSVLADAQLRLQAQAYETMLQAYKEERDDWMSRLVKQPIVWFALGAWMGIQAQ